MRPTTQHRPRGASLLSVLCLLCLPCPSDCGDGPPRLVLNVEGPNSRICGLQFSADSHRLYCGGFSKVVDVWDVGWNLPAGGEGDLRATAVRTLRWEIGRALRGQINAMDLAPSGTRLAIGGTGARGPGTIVIYDTDRNVVEAALPPRFDERQPDSDGHTSSVSALDFSPSGNRLVSVSFDGVIWLWSAPEQAGTDWEKRRIRPKSGTDFDRQPVLFLTENRFVATERFAPGENSRWRLALYTADGERLRPLPQLFSTQVNALAISPTRTSFVAAASNGRVEVISTDDFKTIRALTGTDAREPSAVDFGPDGLVAITRNDRPSGNTTIELWDSATGERLDTRPLDSGENSYSCSFSPDGRLLAVNDDQTLEVHVFRLRTPDGKLRPRPLHELPPTRLRGRGQVVRGAHFERSVDQDQPLRIGMAFGESDRINTVFTPQWGRIERIAADEPAFDAVGPDEFSGGWKIAAADLTSVEIVAPSGLPYVIKLDGTSEGEYRGVYCFVPDHQGRPAAIAIGTDTQAGIYLFRLADNGRTPDMIRYFRDHIGDITSLSVTPDGRYLLSGAQDQTVKLWSLAGLRGSPGFSRSSLWGADFVLRNGRLSVENVLPAGIAYHRNLRNGDWVEFIHSDRSGSLSRIAEPAAILDELEGLPATRQILMETVRGNHRLDPFPIVCGWEPLLTLFIDDRDEWCVFTPEGYFDASVSEGQRLFGWQVNRGSTATPRFDPAGNLQKEFERPDVIREALRLGSLSDALSSLKLPPQADVRQSLALVPTVRIVSPLQSDVFETGGEIPIVARVDFPNAQSLQQFEVTAFQSARALGQPHSVINTELTRLYEWRPLCDEALNEITVVVRESGRAITQALQHSDSLHVRGRNAEEQPPARVHILAIGLEDYRSEAGLPALQFAIDDAQDILPRFTGEDYRSRRLFEPSRQISLLTDHDVTLAAIEQAVTGIEMELAGSPNSRRDLVICYMCGHGSELEGEFYLHPTTLESTDSAWIRRQSIPWTRVCQRLNALPCHVVWMIDACHSGAAVDAAKAIVREANLPNRFVLAAATMNQLSYEDAAYKVDDDDAGHGAFTMAVLRGLDGLADGDATGNGDQIISVSELAEFVRQDVRASTVRRQTPCYVPTSRPPLLSPGGRIPLLRSPQ